MPKGIPLAGDRAAWDADGYPERHANDIDAADGIHHTIGTDEGQVAPGVHTHVEAEITDLDHTDANAIHDDVPGEIAAIDEKTTPDDADVTIIEDSGASYAKKRLSWANIKAALKTYFDTIYAALSHTHTETDITDLDHDAAKINGIEVDLTGIADGDALVYDAYEDKIIPGEGGGGGGGHEIQDNGTPMTQRAALNLIGFTVEDDSGNDATKVTLPTGAYAETIGDGIESDFDVVHNLGTEDIIVQLWDLTGADPVEATADATAITIVDTNTINVAFGSAPDEDAYRVVILKSGGGGGGSGDVVGPDGATDGHLAVFDGVTGKVIKDGGAPGGGGAPTDATYVVTSANGTLSAEIIRPQLAQYFRETPPTSANAKDDEFDDESFDTGKWTQSGTFTTLSETSLPGYLYMDINGGASNAQAYIYQTPPSLPFTIEIKAHALFKANFSLGGIYIYQDGSNEAIFGFIHNSSLRWWGKALGSDRYDISRYVNKYDTGPAFIRVTTPSSIPGTYTVEYSNHGLLWQTVYSGSLNLTPSRIGIALHPNSKSYAKFLVEYFRVS